MAVFVVSFACGCASERLERNVGLDYQSAVDGFTVKAGGKGDIDAYEISGNNYVFVRDTDKDAAYQRYSFAQLGETVMPIGVYTPGSSLRQEIAYATMKENGVNFIMKGSSDLCKKYGFVYMVSIAGQTFDSKEKLYEKYVKDFNNEYFVGLYEDEPGIARIYQLAYYKEMVKELTDGQRTLLACPLLFTTGGTAAFGWNYIKWTGFVDMFDNYKIEGYDELNAIDMTWFDNYYDYELEREESDSGENQLTGTVYNDFYRDVFKPDFMTKTYYPTDAPYPYIATRSIGRVAEYRLNSADLGSPIPLFQYVRLTGDAASQQSGQTQDRVLSEEEVGFQVHTSLAYGAKGIIYYSYGANGSDETGCWGAAVTSEGIRTELYYAAKKVNEQISAVDDVLMTSLFRGVIHTGYVPYDYNNRANVNAYGVISKVNGAHNAIGCFDYDVKADQSFSTNAYYIANTSVVDSELVKIYFNKSVNCYFISDSVRTDYDNVSSLILNIGAGNGGLLVIE